VLRQPAQVRQRWALPPIEPEPEQARFLSLQDVDEVLYGGRQGSGKTWGLLRYALERRHRFPGSGGLIVRRSYTDMVGEDGLLDQAQRMYGGIGTYSAGTRTWRFPDGGTIEFRHCNSEADLSGFRGPRWADISFEEATEFTPKMLQEIALRCAVDRTRWPEMRPQLRYGTNPDGPSNVWFTQEFVDAAPAGEVFTVTSVVDGEEVSRTRCFVPGVMVPYYDRASILARFADAPEELKAARLRGEWHLLSGSFFRQWSKAVHVVEPFAIPDHWHVYVGIDWGFNNPCGLTWGAMDTDGIFWIFKEMRLREKEADEVAAIIHEYNREHGLRPLKYGAGPDLAQGLTRSKRGGKTDKDVFAECGIQVADVCPGALGKRARYSNLRRYLRWRDDAGQREEGRPKIRVFSTCTFLIQQIQEAQTDPNDFECVKDNPADANGLGGDDLLDSATHLCMCRPIQSREPKPAPIPGSIDFIREQERRRRAGRPLLRTRTDSEGREYVVDWKG
jgi:hypothetical protein